MTTYNILLILILFVALILILIVMVQNPKEGGLSSAFGGNANTIGGVKNTNTFLDSSTWTLAISMFVLILLSNFAIPREGSGSNAPDLNETLDPVEAPVNNNNETPATTKDSVR